MMYYTHLFETVKFKNLKNSFQFIMGLFYLCHQEQCPLTLLKINPYFTLINKEMTLHILFIKLIFALYSVSKTISVMEVQQFNFFLSDFMHKAIKCIL